MKLKDIFRINNQAITKEDKELGKSLRNILGFTPKHLPYYIAALTHSSIDSNTKKNNERLEFLGDAILGSIVGEYLFKKYPTQTEGFMSSMRSKIISRNSLNAIAQKMGLRKLIRYNARQRNLHRSDMLGNALEALIGAIYLDTSYSKTKDFIFKTVINNYVDIDNVEANRKDSKSMLYAWTQKENKTLEFKILDEKKDGGRRVFTIGIVIDEKLHEQATGYSKKEAEKNAADKYLGNHLDLLEM